MSRIGKKPIVLPEDVTVELEGQTITVKGKNGSLNYTYPQLIKVALEGNEILVSRPDDEKISRQLHGTVRSLIQNMVVGCHQGFKKVLVLKGTGFRSAIEGKDVVLNVGYSHPIRVEIIPGCKVECSGPNNTIITVTGIDKQAVGQLAAQIRGARKPEPYLGKGVSYQDERIRRKEGKKAGKK
ncbi:50S ribosomal protein L6 [bacterium]|jgi:large subunit ribosomal protein L6|nr:50S ribosomal protein L6 [bacterium]